MTVNVIRGIYYDVSKYRGMERMDATKCHYGTSQKGSNPCYRMKITCKVIDFQGSKDLL